MGSWPRSWVRSWGPWVGRCLRSWVGSRVGSRPINRPLAPSSAPSGTPHCHIRSTSDEVLCEHWSTAQSLLEVARHEILRMPKKRKHPHSPSPNRRRNRRATSNGQVTAHPAIRRDPPGCRTTRRQPMTAMRPITVTTTRKTLVVPPTHMQQATYLSPPCASYMPECIVYELDHA